MDQPSGYFDLQVNGYAGVDFNQDNLTAEDLNQACESLAADGVGGVLVTIITESIDRMAHRLARVVQLREKNALAQSMVAGFHIEGPFISDKPIYHGAHPVEEVGPVDIDQMKRLLDAAGGLARIVTYAPEQDAKSQLPQFLVRQAVVASAGHTDATVEELQAAVDAGCSMVTHVGNGMPMELDRHDNITQRVLSLSGDLWMTFIADGAHIPLFALGNYLRLAGDDRAIIVTDATAPAGLGPGRYTFGRWKVEIDEDLIMWAPGRKHFLGSVMPMRDAAKNISDQLHLPPPVVKKLMVSNPRVATGLSGA